MDSFFPALDCSPFLCAFAPLREAKKSRAKAQSAKKNTGCFLGLLSQCCSLLGFAGPMSPAGWTGRPGSTCRSWRKAASCRWTRSPAQVKRICGDSAPCIGRLGTLSPRQRNSLSAEQLAEWVKENRPRRFLAAELLYAWTVDPKKWADVPLLYAANAELRSDVLHVPLVGEDGRPLEFVSPRQASESAELSEMALGAQKLMMDAERTRHSAKLSAVQQSAFDLAMALGLFEKLSCDPARDRGRSWLNADSRPWLDSDVAGLMDSWRQFVDAYPKMFEADDELADAVKKTEAVMQKLAEAYRPMQPVPPTVAAGDAALGDLRRAATVLSNRVDFLAKRELPENAGLDKSTLQDLTGYRQILARWAEHFAVQAAKALECVRLRRRRPVRRARAGTDGHRGRSPPQRDLSLDQSLCLAGRLARPLAGLFARARPAGSRGVGRSARRLSRPRRQRPRREIRWRDAEVHRPHPRALHRD